MKAEVFVANVVTTPLESIANNAKMAITDPKGSNLIILILVRNVNVVDPEFQTFASKMCFI